jgi:hypothetical protein
MQTIRLFQLVGYAEIEIGEIDWFHVSARFVAIALFLRETEFVRKSRGQFVQFFKVVCPTVFLYQIHPVNFRADIRHFGGGRFAVDVFGNDAQHMFAVGISGFESGGIQVFDHIIEMDFGEGFARTAATIEPDFEFIRFRIFAERGI